MLWYMYGTEIKCNRVSNLFEINKIKSNRNESFEEGRVRKRSKMIRVTMAAKLENEMNDQTHTHTHTRTRTHMSMVYFMNSESTETHSGQFIIKKLDLRIVSIEIAFSYECTHFYFHYTKNVFTANWKVLST